MQGMLVEGRLLMGVKCKAATWVTPRSGKQASILQSIVVIVVIEHIVITGFIATTSPFMLTIVIDVF